MDKSKKENIIRAIRTPRGLILLAICLTLLFSTAEGKVSPDTTADFDSLLRLSKDMTVDQIRHKGRSVFLEQKDPLNALLWYRTALSRPADRFTESDWENLARIYSNIGHIYFYEYGNAQQAFTSLMKSAAICETHGKENPGFALTDIYFTFADIYTSYNDLPKASYYLKKGFDVSLHKDLKKIGYSFANLAWFTILNDSVTSIRKEREQFRKSEASDTSVLVRYCRNILGAMDLIEKNDYKGASRLAETALSDRTFATPDNPDITVLRYHAAALLITAHLHLKTNNTARASQKISEAERIIKANSLFDLYDLLYKKKADYYRQTGNPQAVRECEFRAMKVRDSLYNSQKYGLLRNIEEEWKVSGIEEQLKKKEDERQILLIKHSRQKTVVLTLGISAAAILLLLLWIFRKNRELKDTNASLFRKNVELAEALAERGTTRPETTPSPEETSGEEKSLQPVFEQVLRIFSENNVIYNPDFNIEELSHMTGIHSRRISQAINTCTGKSFSSLLGEYRIAEACRQLTASGMRPTIAAVAENVGYRSRTHFSSVFKSVTGMTTTEFIRQAARSLDAKAKPFTS